MGLTRLDIVKLTVATIAVVVLVPFVLVFALKWAAIDSPGAQRNAAEQKRAACGQMK